MNVAIWGVGQLGKYALEICNECKYRVQTFVDNNAREKASDEGIPVISYEKFQKDFQDKTECILLAQKNSYNILSVLTQLKTCVVKNIGILKPRIMAENFMMDVIKGIEGEIVWVRKEGKDIDVIPRLELNIVDGCNLNCRGCSHFSSLYSKEDVYPIEQYQKDLIQISRAGQLVRLRLLGGEPFLADNLCKYLSIARDIFPDTDIELVTNGLLLPKTEKQILEQIQKENVSVTISMYPPTLKIKESIETILNRYRILWRFEKCGEFSRNLTLQKEHDAYCSSRNCLSNGCVFLKNGRIYKCPVSSLVPIMESRYQVQFLQGDSGVDLYDIGSRLYDSIVDLVRKPVEMCQYCSEENERIKWEVRNNPILQDWLWKDGKIFDRSK